MVWWRAEPALENLADRRDRRHDAARCQDRDLRGIDPPAQRQQAARVGEAVRQVDEVEEVPRKSRGREENRAMQPPAVLDDSTDRYRVPAGGLRPEDQPDDDGRRRRAAATAEQISFEWPANAVLI